MIFTKLSTGLLLYRIYVELIMTKGIKLITIMENNWISVKNTSNSMANKVSDNTITVFICMITKKKREDVNYESLYN